MAMLVVLVVFAGLSLAVRGFTPKLETGDWRGAANVTPTTRKPIAPATRTYPTTPPPQARVSEQARASATEVAPIPATPEHEPAAPSPTLGRPAGTSSSPASTPKATATRFSVTPPGRAASSGLPRRSSPDASASPASPLEPAETASPEAPRSPEASAASEASPTATASPTPVGRAAVQSRPSATPSSTPDGESPGQTLLRLTNNKRAETGCKPLIRSTALTEAAAAHSADMAARRYFSHTSPDGRGVRDRIQAEGAAYRLSAENIAKGQETPEAVFAAWLDSPAHRANLLDCDYDETGVGVARDAEGRVLWTQKFGTR